jgi:hypothetical protein
MIAYASFLFVSLFAGCCRKETALPDALLLGVNAQPYRSDSSMIL